MQVDDAEEHVFCFFRTINGFPYDESTKNYDASVKDYLDIILEDDKSKEGPLDEVPHDMLLDLRKSLKERLEDNVFEYEADWNSDEQKPYLSDEYIEQLCKEVSEALSTVIEQQIKELQHADETGKEDTVAMEIEAHLKFAEGRAEFFTGREPELAAIAEYVNGSCPMPSRQRRGRLR